MSHRVGTGALGRTRRLPATTANNPVAFTNGFDDCEQDENEFDDSNNFHSLLYHKCRLDHIGLDSPVIRDVPWFSQQNRHSSAQRTNLNKNKGIESILILLILLISSQIHTLLLKQNENVFLINQKIPLLICLLNSSKVFKQWFKI